MKTSNWNYFLLVVGLAGAACGKIEASDENASGALGSCHPGSLVAGSVSPVTLAPNGKFTVLCDYGKNTNAIGTNLEVPGPYGICTWTGWSGSTAAQFDCTAGATQGSFPVSCELLSIAPDNFCARTDAVGTLTVGVSTSTGGEPTSDNWTTCASEHEQCAFSGAAQVRYGQPGHYAYKTATDGVLCDNSVFGDPDYGVLKTCDYQLTTTPPSSPPPSSPPPPTSAQHYGTGRSVQPSHITGVTGGGEIPAASTGISAAAYGARGDGATDDTQAIQNAGDAAWAAGKPLVIPATGAFYRVTGTISVRGSVIGTGYPILRMFGATGNGNHALFRVNGISGAVIAGLRLDGNWNGSNQPSGEYDHLISIQSSSNITITDSELANPMGDGIYLGTTGSAPSTNIRVDSVDVINPYRCIVALISSRNVTVSNSNLSKQDNYVDPVHFEPNQDPDGDSNVELVANHFNVPNNSSGANQWGGKSYAGSAVGAWQNSEVSQPGGNIFLDGNWGDFGQAFWTGPGSDGASSWGSITVTSNTAE